MLQNRHYLFKSKSSLCLDFKVLRINGNGKLATDACLLVFVVYFHLADVKEAKTAAMPFLANETSYPLFCYITTNQTVVIITYPAECMLIKWQSQRSL